MWGTPPGHERITDEFAMYSEAANRRGRVAWIQLWCAAQGLAELQLVAEPVREQLKTHLCEGVGPRLAGSAGGVELSGQKDQQQVHALQVQQVGLVPADEV